MQFLVLAYKRSVTTQGLQPHTEGEAAVKFVSMFAFFNARSDPRCTMLPRPMVQHYTVTAHCNLNQLMSPCYSRVLIVKRVALFPHGLFNGRSKPTEIKNNQIKPAQKEWK